MIAQWTWDTVAGDRKSKGIISIRKERIDPFISYVNPVLLP